MSPLKDRQNEAYIIVANIPRVLLLRATVWSVLLFEKPCKIKWSLRQTKLKSRTLEEEPQLNILHHTNKRFYDA